MKALRRNLSLMLAVRYLNPLRTMFSIITLICLGGVALGVMVLIVVLSVMEGLQKEMETRGLAFTPHFIITGHDGLNPRTLTEDDTHWPELRDKISALPGVVSVYPQLENEAFAQGNNARMTVHFTTLEPHNRPQLDALLPMLKEGTFDFGDGLNQECVISATTAQMLGLSLGDQLHLTPVGSIDEIAAVYSMIQAPLQTHEDPAFLDSLRNTFAQAEPTPTGERVPAATLRALMQRIESFDTAKLRLSERDALYAFYDEARDHLGLPFTAEEKQRWLTRATELAELDRDREDGKAVKSITEMVMPMDLEVVGIYQAPENMPGPHIYLPLPIAQDIVGYGSNGKNEIMGLCVRSVDPNQTAALEARIRTLLPNLTPPSESYPSGLYWQVIPWTKSYEQWYHLIANERTMMSFVLSIISLIASFCIMAVMFTMSMQRKREIAVLQALGATPAKIMGIFTWQGIIIGLGGAILGVGLALLVLHYRLEIQAAMAAMDMDPFPMEAHGITLPAAFTPGTFARQALQAFLMVTIASVIPAFFISRQDPSKALRSN